MLVFTSDNGSPQKDGTNMRGPDGSIKKYGHDPSRPWKGLKADIWEGGHRIPFITSWPKKIKANTISNQVVCLTDLMPSLASILGIEIEVNTMEDGCDMSPILFGNEKAVRTSVVHHSWDGTFAIRKGDWKLIEGKHSGGFRALKIEGIPVETKGQLYNLSKDPSENNNLYAMHPDKVKELTDLLNSQKAVGYTNR